MVKYGKGGGYPVIWFAEKPSFFDGSVFLEYRQVRSTAEYQGFMRSPFHTIHISLDGDDASILASFSKGTRYEVNRAMRDGVFFSSDVRQDDFVRFYNEFALLKSRKCLAPEELDLMGAHLSVTSAGYGDEVLVMHCYLLDMQLRKVRLLYSASHFRAFGDSAERNLVARANRMLHYKDMLYYRERGYSCYDLGGISLEQNDQEKAHIANFKAGFGGCIVEESHYISVPLVVMRGLKNRMQRIRLNWSERISRA